MSDVQRWKPYYPEMSMVGMVGDDRGMWVKWEDYSACARERVRLESALLRLEAKYEDLVRCTAELCDEVKLIRSQAPHDQES